MTTWSACFAQVIQLGPNHTGLSYDVGDAGSETLTVDVSEVMLDPVVIDGETWASVQVPQGLNWMERGLPSLPYLTTDFLLGLNDRVHLELVEMNVQTIDVSAYGYVGVAPSKGHFTRDVDPDSISWVFEPRVYQRGQPYPEWDPKIDAPYIAGPLRGQAMRIPVARWENDQLVVITHATFRVVRGIDPVNPRTRTPGPMTSLFDQMRDAGMVNSPADDPPPYAPLVETGRLLILADDAFLEEIEPLADWETQVGYPTILTPMSDVPHVGGSPTATEIHDYIQALYDAPESLTWIILVGDAQQVPYLTGVYEGAACDACYTKLEGADNYPDAAISRISAQTEAQVTVQVDKILEYEQNPDAGGAAAWYTKAFGVAGNDTGGTPSYADWERMNFLRDDLLAPSYHYTEFTEIYHYPSTSDVANAVNDGRSLGLYIGHGSETAWSTSGFSVTNVNNDLSNGTMLPMIWDVACVNGRFQRSGGDCFAEAWLKKSGGGAVSFEAATTNESWVPPCNAQRGIVDALRFGWAFTTGGQHVDGKIYCLGTDGSTNGSEGTKFMEQSTLFGSCVTWPRTLEPQAIDMPTDFTVSAGQASLTVTVGGVPLNQANAAIVNFYIRDGNDITVCGSGLIDENGVVTADVTGSPTHCHIHGNNLIAAEFELAAQPNGMVTLSAATFPCGALAGIRVSDSNIPGTSPGVIDTVDVTVDVDGDDEIVTLTEEAADKDIYVGNVDLSTFASASHGDTVTVTYIDADDGAGHINVVKTDTAQLDCQGPVITNVDAVATQDTVIFSFETDEPGDTVVYYWTPGSSVTTLSDPALVAGSHVVSDDGFDPCTTVTFYVESTDAVGNTTIDNRLGANYLTSTAGWGVLFEEPLDALPADWVIDNGGNANGWAFGQPTGQAAGSTNDPTEGATGDFVFGVNLEGGYDPYLSHDQLKLTSPPVDCSDATSVFLRFQRWLGVEYNTYDHARIYISVDGGAWQEIWANGSTSIRDSAWAEETYDVSALAVGYADVRFRWTMGSSDSYVEYCGWNIDDIVVEGAVPCGGGEVIFLDGFETGDCSGWSVMADGH